MMRNIETEKQIHDNVNKVGMAIKCTEKEYDTQEIERKIY